MQYFNQKRVEGLRSAFPIDDVARTLSVDQKLATVIYDFVVLRRGEFARIIGMDIFESLKERQVEIIGSLASSLKIDSDWVSIAVNYLVEKRYVFVEGDTLKLITVSVG